MSSLIAVLAIERAPPRVNMIAAGFVDTPMSASLLGDGARHAGITSSPGCPYEGSSPPRHVAALGVHLMSNTALTGAVYDIDGGQQLIP